MKKRTWHSGEPPEIGWWPASYERDPEVVRWWDGENWSDGIACWRNARAAGQAASFPAASSERIEWCERWW